MRKHLASPALLVAVIASFLSFGVVAAEAQTPPAASAPATAPSVTAAKPSKPAKASVAQPARKYEHTYKQCKMRALRHGLKGAERRAFIRRCELGFAPPRKQTSPEPINPPNTAPSPAPAPAPHK